MITLEDLFKKIGYEGIHEASPFPIFVDGKKKGRVEWADSKYVGVRIGDRMWELEHLNLGWIYINPRSLIRNLWS